MGSRVEVSVVGVSMTQLVAAAACVVTPKLDQIRPRTCTMNDTLEIGLPSGPEKATASSCRDSAARRGCLWRERFA